MLFPPLFPGLSAFPRRRPARRAGRAGRSAVCAGLAGPVRALVVHARARLQLRLLFRQSAPARLFPLRRTAHVLLRAPLCLGLCLGTRRPAVYFLPAAGLRAPAARLPRLRNARAVSGGRRGSPPLLRGLRRRIHERSRRTGRGTGGHAGGRPCRFVIIVHDSPARGLARLPGHIRIVCIHGPLRRLAARLRFVFWINGFLRQRAACQNAPLLSHQRLCGPAPHAAGALFVSPAPAAARPCGCGPAGPSPPARSFLLS